MKVVLEEGATHSEGAWAGRLGGALTFLFGRKPAGAGGSNLPPTGAVQPAMKMLIAASLLTLSVAFPGDSAHDQPTSGAATISGTWRSRLSESWVRREGERWVSLELQREASRNYGASIRLSELEAAGVRGELFSGSDVRFALRRDAGTLEFEGAFDAGLGSGRFRFAPNAAFVAALQKTGRQLSADDALRLAIHDVTRSSSPRSKRPVTRAWPSRTS